MAKGKYQSPILFRHKSTKKEKKKKKKKKRKKKTRKKEAFKKMNIAFLACVFELRTLKKLIIKIVRMER